MCLISMLSVPYMPKDAWLVLVSLFPFFLHFPIFLSLSALYPTNLVAMRWQHVSNALATRWQRVDNFFFVLGNYRKHVGIALETRW